MSTPDKDQRPALRYKRFGGGYRREDVEAALAELRLTLRQLDADLESLRDRNRELETDMVEARREVESLHGKEHQLSQTIASALRRAAEIEEDAQSRAREILAQADAAAMRIRTEATRRIEGSSAQLGELLHLKNNLLDKMRGVVADFDEAISRVERGEQLFPGATAAPAMTEPEPVPIGESAPAPPFVTPPPPAPEPTYAPPLPADALAIPAAPPPPPTSPAVESEGIFDTRVELDAGPFSDFAALSAFERALAHLPKVEDVYVRRLADDRALIELTLAEPAALLDSMRTALPYHLDVKSANRSRIVVNVTAQAPAGAY